MTTAAHHIKEQIRKTGIKASSTAITRLCGVLISQLNITSLEDAAFYCKENGADGLLRLPNCGRKTVKLLLDILMAAELISPVKFNADFAFIAHKLQELNQAIEGQTEEIKKIKLEQRGHDICPVCRGTGKAPWDTEPAILYHELLRKCRMIEHENFLIKQQNKDLQSLVGGK